jgi:hypothetical protein
MDHDIRRKLSQALFASVCLLIIANPVLAADKFIGVWKLNLAKSKYNRDKQPRNLKLKWLLHQNNGVKFSAQRFAAEGSVQYIAFYDGKDYPVRYDEGYDTVSLKRIDANTVECTYKKNGTVVSTSRRTVSPDGSSLTVTATGRNAEGDPQTTAEYDKEAVN